MSHRIVCFGEIMLRLNPSGHLRLVQAESLEMTYAGAEANVAVSLSSFGLETSFVTRVPDNALGRSARNAVRRYGVGTADFVWGGPRLGAYYVEKGASQRPSTVIYDRAGSSMHLAGRDDFNWDAILAGATWFHFTGITPALGGECPQICKDALETCRRKGVTVSCDLNYRKKLWDRKLAREVMTGLVPYVDVLIANESDAADVFGIAARGSDVERGFLEKESYVDVARELSRKFGVKKVALTLRTSLSASVNKWSGMLYGEERVAFAPEYAIQVVDRVGSGDSFGAGLIYSFLQGYDDQRAIDFAVAASCLKHTVEHDYNLVSVSEVESLVAGNTSGRVQR